MRFEAVKITVHAVQLQHSRSEAEAHNFAELR